LNQISKQGASLENYAVKAGNTFLATFDGMLRPTHVNLYHRTKRSLPIIYFSDPTPQP